MSYKPGHINTTTDSQMWDPDPPEKVEEEKATQKTYKVSRGKGKPVRREGVVKNPGRRSITDRGRVAIIAPQELAGTAQQMKIGTRDEALAYRKGSKLSYYPGDPANLQLHGISEYNEEKLMTYRDEIIKNLPPQPEGEIRTSHLLIPDSQLRYRFLTAIKRLGTISRACEVCGLTNWDIEKAKHSSPEFARAIDQARGIYAATIQEEAYRRAVEGVEEPIINKDGNIAGYRRIYSDALTALLLKATNPDEFATRKVKHEGTITHGHMPTIDANKLRALSPEERSAFRSILVKLMPDVVPPPEIGEHVPKAIDASSDEEEYINDDES